MIFCGKWKRHYACTYYIVYIYKHTYMHTYIHTYSNDYFIVYRYTCKLKSLYVHTVCVSIHFIKFKYQNGNISQMENARLLMYFFSRKWKHNYMCENTYSV